MFGRVKRIVPAALTVLCILFVTSNRSGALGESAPSPHVNNRRESTDLESDTWRALRNQGLSRTAEIFCRSRLNAAPLGSDARARWSIRLSAVLTDRALSIDTAEAWTDAGSPCDEFIQSAPQSTRLPWVRLQRHLVDVSAARDVVLRLLASPAPEKIRPVALQLIRQTYDRLEQLAKQIRDSRQEDRSGTTGATIDGEEWRGLLADTLSPMAELLLLRSQCYPLQSNDALAAATEAERIGMELLNDWPITTPRGLMATRMRVQAKLVSSDVSEAALLCETLRLSTDPQDLATCIRVATAQKEWSSIKQIADRAAQSHGELALAQLAAIVAQGASGNGISQQLTSIERQYGSYWRRRAELEVLPTQDVDDETPALLQARGVQLVGTGKLVEAAELFTRATRAQLASDAPEPAMEMALQGAAVFSQLKNQKQSIELLRSTSLALTKHPKAPLAHLQAAYLIGQEPNSIDLFLLALGEHLQHWPDHETSEKGVTWIYEQGTRQDRLPEAATALLKTAHPSNRAGQSLTRAVELWSRFSREQWYSRNEEVQSTLQNAIEQLQQFATDGGPLDQQAELLALYLHVVYVLNPLPLMEPQSDPLIDLLRRIRKDQAVTPEQWDLLSGELSETQRLMLTDGARTLVEIGRRGNAPPELSMGTAVLKLLEQATDLGDRDWMRAHALGWGEKWPEAIRVAASLPRESVNHSPTTLANYWGSLKGTAPRESALKLWDIQARGAALGSKAWRQSRLQTAMLLIALERRAEAKQLIEVVLATVSDEEAAEFEQLAAQL